jgi:hypothetical protein
MSDHDARRRHARVDTKQPVWVEGQDVLVEAEARNMSKGGMFVVAKAEPPTIGSTLQIKFDDPLEGAVELKMEVVWRDEGTSSSRLGLRVMDAGGSAAFERVVARYEEEQAERPTGRTLRPSALPSEPRPPESVSPRRSNRPT